MNNEFDKNVIFKKFQNKHKIGLTKKEINFFQNIGMTLKQLRRSAKKFQVLIKTIFEQNV